jgi:hypothetical protein
MGGVGIIRESEWWSRGQVFFSQSEKIHVDRDNVFRHAGSVEFGCIVGLQDVEFVVACRH